MLDKILMILLCINAAWVAQGTVRKKNMWKWISLYWVILTIKSCLQVLG